MKTAVVLSGVAAFILGVSTASAKSVLDMDVNRTIYMTDFQMLSQNEGSTVETFINEIQKPQGQWFKEQFLYQTHLNPDDLDQVFVADLRPIAPVKPGYLCYRVYWKYFEYIDNRTLHSPGNVSSVRYCHPIIQWKG